MERTQEPMMLPLRSQFLRIYPVVSQFRLTQVIGLRGWDQTVYNLQSRSLAWQQLLWQFQSLTQWVNSCVEFLMKSSFATWPFCGSVIKPWLNSARFSCCDWPSLLSPQDKYHLVGSSWVTPLLYPLLSDECLRILHASPTLFQKWFPRNYREAFSLY